MYSLIATKMSVLVRTVAGSHRRRGLGRGRSALLPRAASIFAAVDLLEEHQLLTGHDVAANLELAAEVQLVRVGFPRRHVEEVAVRKFERAVRLRLGPGADSPLPFFRSMVHTLSEGPSGGTETPYRRNPRGPDFCRSATDRGKHVAARQHCGAAWEGRLGWAPPLALGCGMSL